MRRTVSEQLNRPRKRSRKQDSILRARAAGVKPRPGVGVLLVSRAMVVSRRSRERSYFLDIQVTNAVVILNRAVQVNRRRIIWYRPFMGDLRRCR